LTSACIKLVMKQRELHGVPTFAAAWTMFVPREQGVLHKSTPAGCARGK
jgi:hypothetical protein